MPGDRTGVKNAPRQRLLRRVEETLPGFEPVADMAYLAYEAKEELLRRLAKAEADAKRVKDGGLPADEAEPKPTLADRALVVGMYEKVAVFFHPKLKAQQITTDQPTGTNTLSDAALLAIANGQKPPHG